MSNDKRDLENIELELLLSAIDKRYGYDFTDYSRPSLKRRIDEFIFRESLSTHYRLIEAILADENYFKKFIFDITVSVTEMFRDPIFFDQLRHKVIPILKTYPTIHIWHAGCSTGEEPYSMAILLKEAGLLDRSKIYATDIDESSIETGKNGIYSLDKIKKYTDNYLKCNGESDFSNYYHVRYDSAIMYHRLRKHIFFSKHNLVADHVFHKFNLILCRNVLIYFNKNLQNRVLTLLNDSLDDYAYLCLGMKETLSTSIIEDQFETIDQKAKIYRKKI